jgi:hypothetical protein
MSAFAQGTYTVVNIGKYVGKKPPYFRSSWELAFMRMCDNHPNILKWANESIAIPYLNPFTGRHANYIPDFMIQYRDKDGREHVELIEIKPSSQTTLEAARGKREQAQAMLNAAKWTAAQEWCQRKGIRFKILNEEHIFQTNKPRQSKKRIPKKKTK